MQEPSSRALPYLTVLNPSEHRYTLQNRTRSSLAAIAPKVTITGKLPEMLPKVSVVAAVSQVVIPSLRIVERPEAAGIWVLAQALG